MRRNVFILLAIAIFFSLTTGQVFSQDQAQDEWVLGDVIALDLESNQLTLAYIDYDNDAAEEMTINVDANTNYDNVDSFSDIKVGDVVSIDYSTCCGGKNTASNISVEIIKEGKEAE